MGNGTNEVLLADQAATLIRREEVAEGIVAFHFEKPSGFSFRAGQFADVTLTDPLETDAKGNTRTFSIASPPFANELVFTTRMRNAAFKRSLKASGVIRGSEDKPSRRLLHPAQETGKASHISLTLEDLQGRRGRTTLH